MIYCTDLPDPNFLIFSTATPVLLYYSHIPTALLALILSAFIFLKNRSSLPGKILSLTALFFALWSLFDLILWTNNDGRVIMFFWSLINLFELLVSLFTLYFSYVFLFGRDVLFKYKMVAGVLISPFIALIPTNFNLPQFLVDICEAQQGPLLKYFYFLEVFFLSWLLLMLFYKIVKASNIERKQVVQFSIGVILFLVSFSGTNLIGSVLGKWEILQYGLFGMPIFLGFLAYLIVRYRAFNIKMFGAQALVAALIILIGSQYFFVRDAMSIALTGITLSLSIVFGYILIKSVGHEVEGKEQLQAMADKLAMANEELKKLDNAKTEFLSIASHQLRTPLTAIKGFISLILEGAYGKVEPEMRGALNKIAISSERLIQLVEDLLNVSRIESGRMQYRFESASLSPLLEDLCENFALVAKQRDLYLDLKLPEGGLPEINMDPAKMREVLSNLIDNALKYTEKGGVTVRAEKLEAVDSKTKASDVVRVTVADTGIGIPAEEIPYLFQKFSRGKDTKRLHVGGTGLGLYVGKNIVEAHGGQIWIESDGAGRGTKFIMELPIIKH